MTTGEKFERIMGYVQSQGSGGVSFSFDDDGAWSGMAVFGKEAIDSPMAGGASHSIGATLDEAVETMARELRLLDE